MKKRLLILSVLGIFLMVTGGCYVKTDVYKKEMSQLRDQIAMLGEEVAADSQKIESTSADVEETRARLEELGGEISSLVETLSVSQKSLEEIKTKLEEISFHVEALRGELDLKIYVAYKELTEALLGQLEKKISSLTEEKAPE